MESTHGKHDMRHIAGRQLGNPAKQAELAGRIGYGKSPGTLLGVEALREMESIH